MAYETSYDSGLKPLMPDLQRGYWASPTDFVYVCLCFAFKTDLLGVSFYHLVQMGFYGIITYAIAASVIVVPTMFILMYLGQFSSSGFITALRISPLFKGIGYVNLFTNLILLAYYSIFATVPMLYLINSFRPILPWSCESMRAWANASEFKFGKFCNSTLLDSESEDMNSNETIDVSSNSSDSGDWDEFENTIVHLPSVVYFKSYFSDLKLNNYTLTEFSFSWDLVFYTFLAWALIALTFYTWFEIEKLGRLLRHLFWIVLGLLMVCIVRFAFLPGAHKPLIELFLPSSEKLNTAWPSIPISVLHAFSTGWGILVALSSHNRFQANIMRYSWLICFGQLLINLGFALLTRLIQSHIHHIEHVYSLVHVEMHWILYLSAGTALTSMPWANFWSIIYFLMLIMASLMVMITSLITIYSSIFDEYEILRKHKLELRMTLIALLAVCSIVFCSNHGLQYFDSFFIDSLIKQVSICLLVVTVVLWIYGRERFQRDIEFMFRQPFATWKVFLLRVVTTPMLALALLLLLILIVTDQLNSNDNIFETIGSYLILVPLFIIPIYAIVSMLQTAGPFCVRFKRCCRPTDWYPIAKEDRQRYEEALGNMDITQQLQEVPNAV